MKLTKKPLILSIIDYFLKIQLFIFFIKAVKSNKNHFKFENSQSPSSSFFLHQETPHKNLPITASFVRGLLKRLPSEQRAVNYDLRFFEQERNNGEKAFSR